MSVYQGWVEDLQLLGIGRSLADMLGENDPTMIAEMLTFRHCDSLTFGLADQLWMTSFLACLSKPNSLVGA